MKVDRQLVTSGFPYGRRHCCTAGPEHQLNSLTAFIPMFTALPHVCRELPELRDQCVECIQQKQVCRVCMLSHTYHSVPVIAQSVRYSKDFPVPCILVDHMQHATLLFQCTGQKCNIFTPDSSPLCLGAYGCRQEESCVQQAAAAVPGTANWAGPS